MTAPSPTAAATSPRVRAADVCAYGMCHDPTTPCGGCCSCLGGCLKTAERQADCVAAATAHAGGHLDRPTDKDTTC